MRLNSIWFMRTVFAFLVLILFKTDISESGTKSLNVSFKLESPITLNEPVAIAVIIENEAPYAITIDLGLQRKDAYHFRITTPDNKQIDPPAKIHKGMSGTIYLKTKEKYTQRLLLNEWHPFEAPGDYRIRVSLDMPIIIGETHLPSIGSMDESEHQTEESSCNLTILPRDETVLRNRCEELLRKLQEGYEFFDRTPYAEELSYIKDPVAIPYLARLAEEQEEYYAIQGLMRIGTDEAMEAMIAVTQSEYDKGAAASAKDILRKKLADIKDPNIQKKVNDSINH
jgi:hypothetical protein